MDLLLTALLFILPFFLQRDIPRPGLFIGLWVSLFFWGRLTPILSLLVFACALIYSVARYKTPSGQANKPYMNQQSLSIKRASLPQFLLFVSALTMFCALGEVVSSYGAFIGITEPLHLQAKGFGFITSLLGPLWFGLLSDKKGPFHAMMTLLLTAALAVSMSAYSSISPELFPLGEGMLWLSISGTFVLLPVFMELYLGRLTLFRTFPRYLVLLAGLWGTIHYAFVTDPMAVEHSASFLILAVILLLAAALFGTLAWKNRLVIVH